MTQNFFYRHITNIFDQLETLWESSTGQRVVGTVLVFSFLISLLGIELNRLGLLPEYLDVYLGSNHLKAIEIVFTALLFFELISLIFSLAYSVSISMGKQFEVLSLFLLRDSFKQFSHLGEPLLWEEISPALTSIIGLAIAALLIFVILGFYYKSLKRHSITSSQSEKSSFVAAKKLIALLLLFSFVTLLFLKWTSSFPTNQSIFEYFFTILIFSDIMLMLIAMRYGSSYRIAFRNSGFAVATLMIRLAFISPVLISALLGVGSALFILGVSLAYNSYTPSSYQQLREQNRGRKNASKKPPL